MRDLHADAPFRLITIPFSHYCEKARWALDRVGVPYVEEPHAPLFHYPFTQLRGGGRTVPVLVSRAGVFADSTDILRYADGFAPAGQGLYPEDPAARRDVEQLEDLFDRELGTEGRLWGYHQLLPRSDLAVRMLRAGTPPAEAAMLPFVFPFARAFLWRALGISEQRAARALECVERIFADVEARLDGGRPFLVGDRLSAADVTFAALSVPVLAPPEAGLPLDDSSGLPAAMTATIDRLRRRPAGAFALRLYRDHRRRTS
jgi:glutathione S-transferase